MTKLQKFCRRHPELVDPYRIPVSLLVAVSNNIRFPWEAYFGN